MLCDSDPALLLYVGPGLADSDAAIGCFAVKYALAASPACLRSGITICTPHEGVLVA
ncbi:unannotated protein [freshwater metagenome]|uniref:Unannotated protein n=1 Tax=freshwater metagenome TaxID=449393 RepID=A0A6J7KFS3_9ZZZZ